MQNVIVGAGYVGRRLLAALNGQALVLGHSPDKVEALAALSEGVILQDLDALNPAVAWPGAGCVWYTVPPTPEGGEDWRMQEFLQWVAVKPPARIVYLSTSGVYGDCEGAWVDEERPSRPWSDRARRRLDAERLLQRFAEDLAMKLVVLRVPGIYGPERLPLARLKSGAPVLSEAIEQWTNRVHVDDLVQACLLAAQYEGRMQVFNVCDDEPKSMTAYMFAVADAFGIPRPPMVAVEQAQAELGEAMMSYLDESRRLCNDLMKNELGLELRYPSLEDGLAAIRSEVD